MKLSEALKIISEKFEIIVETQDNDYFSNKKLLKVGGSNIYVLVSPMEYSDGYWLEFFKSDKSQTEKIYDDFIDFCIVFSALSLDQLKVIINSINA